MSRLVAVTSFIMTADPKHELLSLLQRQLGDTGDNTEKAILTTVPRTHWPPPSGF